MQPFANLLESLHALGAEEADCYAAKFALNRAENCDKCFLKLLLEVVLWCCVTIEESDVHHRFRQCLVQHVHNLLKEHHVSECVLYEEVPEARHLPSPGALECLCSRLHRYYETYFGILEIQGGRINTPEAGREFTSWLAGLFERWTKTRPACKEFERVIAENDPWV